MENQRIRVTKSMLKNALIDLLQEKPLEKITVYELCSRATINRTTFYKYYGSQYDLLDDIENDVFNELEERLKIVHEQRKLVLAHFLDYFKQESKKCLVLMNSTADKDFAKKLFQMPIINDLFQIVVNPCSSKEMTFYVEAFLYNGSYSIVREWANRGFKESSAEIENLILTLLSSRILAV